MAAGVVGDGVDGGTTVHEVGGLLERGCDLGVGGFLAGLLGAGGELFAGDALLFTAQQVERDGFGVGQFEQLAGFLLQLGEPGTCSGDLLQAVLLAAGNLGSELLGDGLGVELVEADGERPGLLKLPFYLFGGDVGQLAGAEPVPPAAHEVGEQAAVPAAYLAVDHPGAAACAAQQSAQVVAVGALLGGRLVAFGDEPFDAGEQFWSDEGVVQSVVFDAAVADEAEVVAVVQQLLQLGQRDGLGWSLRGGADGQALVGELAVELAGGVFAAGVQLEGAADERGSFLVDHDGADFVAVDHLADVEVADRGEAGGAASAGFLGGAFEDFGGEVGAVELGQVGHDVAHEPAGWCLVDAFGDADELRSGSLDGDLDFDVVGPVAGESVDLVDDDVVDAALLGQVGE